MFDVVFCVKASGMNLAAGHACLVSGYEVWMVLVMVEVFGLTIDSRQVVFCLYGSIFVMLVAWLNQVLFLSSVYFLLFFLSFLLLVFGA